MTKAEAYWILEELRKECFSSLYAEAFGIAQECIEFADLMSERNQTMTNADHIRSMTDEELKVFLCGIAATNCCGACMVQEYCWGEHNGFGEWLKQPYKEDDDV